MINQHYGMEHRQHGFTLVEIMVALVVGLVLLAGIGQLLTGNRQTYRFQNNVSQLQENGRFALELLGRNLRMAGFRNYPNTPLPNPLTGVEGGVGADQITIRFQSSTDCLSNNVAGTLPIAVNQFYIANSGGVPNLFCNGNGGGGTPQPLIAGVESMDILYGEDTTPKSGVANQYVPANAVSNMADVVSVRIQLVVRSPDDNLTDTITASGDRRIRQTFTSTITLRNSDVNIANIAELL